MIVQTKIVSLETVVLDCDDIADAIECGLNGVCRAIITPEVAKFILENHNGHNRPEKAHHIKFLCNQMRDGRFTYNGETVCFCTDGNLGDGQHRLRAAVITQTTIETLVVFGVAADAFTTYDQGARRCGADVLSIDGEAQCHRLAGCLRQIDNYYGRALGAIDSPKNSSRSGDNSYASELLEKYPAARESVRLTAKIGRLTRPSLAGAIHYLCAQLNRAAADEFFDVVMEGVQVGRRYDPSIASAAGKLRNRLLENAMGNKRMTNQVIAGLWCKAWNAARSGNVPRLLSYRREEGHIELK